MDVSAGTDGVGETGGRYDCSYTRDDCLEVSRTHYQRNHRLTESLKHIHNIIDIDTHYVFLIQRFRDLDLEFYKGRHGKIWPQWESKANFIS